MRQLEILEAIEVYGAKAVYEAAHRHMAGDRVRGLPSVGFHPKTMGDVWAAMDAGYAGMSDSERAIEAASASSALVRIGESGV